MYPELFHIGGFPVNTYGVLLALAFMAALFVASRLGGRDRPPRGRLFDLGLWMLYGGFLGGLLTGVLLIRRYGLSFWKVTDAFAPGVALGQAIGREGCFAAWCCWGESCELPWAVTFPDEAALATGVPS